MSKKFGTGNSHVGDGMFDGYNEDAEHEPPSDPVVRRVLEEVARDCGLKCAWEV